MNPPMSSGGMQEVTGGGMVPSRVTPKGVTEGLGAWVGCDSS